MIFRLSVGEHPAHAAELLVRQDRRALQRLAQQLARSSASCFLWPRRDHALVVGKLAVDDLDTSSMVPKRNADLVRRDLDRHRRRRCRPAAWPARARSCAAGSLPGAAARRSSVDARIRQAMAVGGDQLAACLPRPPAAGRSGSSGCPAAPSRTARARAARAAPSAAARTSAPRRRPASPCAGKSSAGSVCRLKRLLPAFTCSRLSCCSSVTSAPSGSARRMS